MCHGAIRDIGQILDGCFFGDHAVEALKIMRNSKLISVLTYNIEVIHNLNKSDIQRLDKVDLLLIRKSLSISSKSTRCLILLELGLIPVKFLIMQKRMNFLHHLLTLEKPSLANSVFVEQVKKPVKGDFVQLVRKDLNDCHISLSSDEIRNLPKNKFKEFVKEKVEEAAFTELVKEKYKTSKGNLLKYDELKTQNYLLPGGNLNYMDMKRILQMRIRDTPVRSNFGNAFGSKKCPASECSEEETQEHLYSSSCWNDKEDKTTVSNDTKYENVFEDDINKQFEVMTSFFHKLKKEMKLSAKTGHRI